MMIIISVIITTTIITGRFLLQRPLSPPAWIVCPRRMLSGSLPPVRDGLLAISDTFLSSFPPHPNRALTTNAEMYEAMDPSSDTLPYVYAHFDYPHCEALGISVAGEGQGEGRR
jgi:hypothetical protein